MSNRLAFAHLYDLDNSLSQLKTEWGRLLIEKTTWSARHNIADSVGSRLGMHPPPPEKIVTVYLEMTRSTIILATSEQRVIQIHKHSRTFWQMAPKPGHPEIH